MEINKFGGSGRICNMHHWLWGWTPLLLSIFLLKSRLGRFKKCDWSQMLIKNKIGLNKVMKF